MFQYFILLGIVGEVFDFLGSVLSQQKFEAMDQCYSPRTDQCYGSRMDQCYSSMLQLCVTAQFYLGNKGKYILEAWGHANPKDVKRRERERGPQPFGSSFYLFFPLPLGLPYVNWASQQYCLFYLRSSLWSLDCPLFYFCRLFPSLSFSHHHSSSFFLF